VETRAGVTIDRAGAAGGRECPLCGGRSAHAFSTTDRNRSLTDEVFGYRRCERCGVIFLDNVPGDLGAFYPTEYYTPAEELDRAADAEEFKLDMIRAHVAAGRLVEIGPGAGAFAYAARRAGFEVTAVEMDEGACEHLRNVVKVEAVQSDTPGDVLDRLPASRAVALWHVLEHVPDPWRCLESVARNLEPGGVAAVAVPNADSMQLRLMGGRWPHIDAPRHLYLYPPALLIERMRGHGLELVELTATDPGGRRCDLFGWQQVWVRPGGPKARTAFALAFGGGAYAVMSPIERRGLRGSTFTAIFRKPDSAH
jgi:SAM-dependent methyltransferase